MMFDSFNSKTMGVTSGAEILTLRVNPSFSGVRTYCSIFSFLCSVFLIFVCPIFFLVMVLSVLLRFTVSDNLPLVSSFSFIPEPCRVY